MLSCMNEMGITQKLPDMEPFMFASIELRTSVPAARFEAACDRKSFYGIQRGARVRE